MIRGNGIRTEQYEDVGTLHRSALTAELAAYGGLALLHEADE